MGWAENFSATFIYVCVCLCNVQNFINNKYYSIFMYEFLRSYQNILENFDTEKNYFAWGVSKSLKSLVLITNIKFCFEIAFLGMTAILQHSCSHIYTFVQRILLKNSSLHSVHRHCSKLRNVCSKPFL